MGNMAVDIEDYKAMQIELLRSKLALQQTQCELLAAQKNRDEWKAECQRLRAESGGLLNDLR